MSETQYPALSARKIGLLRRRLLQTLAAASVALTAGVAFAQSESSGSRGARPKEIRFAYQRGGILVVAQQQKVLEKFFQPHATEIVWKLFSYGNPALEAVNVGSMDFSSSGNTPIIFAQAAGFDVQYVAAQRSGDGGEGIVVLPQSGIRHVGELKGKKVAVAKGTSSHYFLVAALQKAGLGYEDVTAVFLAPSDAPGALSRGDVSAWVVWDPYLALAEQRFNGRVIEALGPDIKSYNFLVVRRGFANEHPEALREVLTQLRPIGSWAQDHRNEIAQQLAEITGIELETQRPRCAARQLCHHASNRRHHRQPAGSGRSVLQAWAHSQSHQDPRCRLELAGLRHASRRILPGHALGPRQLVSRTTMIIDSHVHVGTFPSVESAGHLLSSVPDVVAFRTRHRELYEQFAHEEPLDNGETLIGDMDRFGIGKAIVQSRPGVGNDLVAAIAARDPGRLIPIAVPTPWPTPIDDPREPRNMMSPKEVAAELERCIADLGMVGVGEIFVRRLTRSLHPEDIADDLAPMMEVIARHQTSVQIPTAWTQLPGGLYYGDPIWVDEVASRYPSARIILTKMGRGIDHYFENCLSVAMRNENVYLEISGSSSSHLRRALQVIGPKRLLFGTDWSPVWRFVRDPAPVVLKSIRNVEEATEDPNIRRQLFSLTALSLYDVAISRWERHRRGAKP
ncbi:MULTISPECIES: aliphatic sulfonate ABC transporter substrate-binding protein [Bradyrhizobium]|jgi:aliphatic sulfonates family ABC transporter substrate-binding protein|uniref:aliphatic sulfonate ABC transporter substrate-binding protein n=1 Tax=Bradyrhizobium TaxID=374 RepID=UPI0004B6A619|nr:MULTISPECIES: aliphatic sulfonate ABC transporter substrate-binding protein [Bradyrhizobium]MCS3451199.1 aliphatic sulfonates family ABC transporter substrate-binding protein [Bradyrhizobium elkanii]MCS3566778.1 aliphatic sulfonates family ABC transporter substrate-binding protein [Bradyrhizobium elkanii]MCW2152498.1 aliphatic sulfonates family ABC transporter substrate-binding protein [Bradyrhizobium elkanii]MCW2376228.1 aliphatic sulfonates family ABC transporter substrate-binding protein 